MEARSPIHTLERVTAPDPARAGLDPLDRARHEAAGARIVDLRLPWSSVLILTLQILVIQAILGAVAGAIVAFLYVARIL